MIAETNKSVKKNNISEEIDHQISTPSNELKCDNNFKESLIEIKKQAIL